MKNFIIILIVLIIAAACVWFVCTTRANAVEHYACKPASAAAPTALTVDYAKRTAAVEGGAFAGSYAGVTITADEVSWQGKGEFTLNRRSGRFSAMHNADNVMNLSTAECEPKSFYDRIVVMVN